MEPREKSASSAPSLLSNEPYLLKKGPNGSSSRAPLTVLARARDPVGRKTRKGCLVFPEPPASLQITGLAAVQSAWPYRRDLHVVAEAPDGRLAASCIGWLDPATGVAAIEPLGVHPEDHRRGLAGALCLYAARLVAGAGGHELVIHPRGDAAYPAARGAYLRCGFAEAGHARIYAPS